MTRIIDTVVTLATVASLALGQNGLRIVAAPAARDIIMALALMGTGQIAQATVVLHQAGMPNSCANGGTPRYSGQTAAGWKAIKVAGGLKSPRGIVLDTAGRLLVVQVGKGISAMSLTADGCVASTKQVVSDQSLNHGIALSADGKTLYASSMTTVFAYPYNAASGTAGTSSVVVSGMNTGGHATRTLAMNKAKPNLLVVSQGSNANLDYASASPTVARACVKVFDLSKAPTGGYNYVGDGSMVGYGLRNEVGVTFDGNNQLWGVENSGDNFQRTVNSTTADIHMDNPAEKLNFLGDISKPAGKWYGYPTCFQAWQPSTFPDAKKPAIGAQFVLAPNATLNDATCVQKSTPARLVMQAHSAPIDAAFDQDYKNMYVTFHGSWDRSPPTGYKVVVIPFKKGTNGYEPVAGPNSNKGYTDVWWNTDVTKCSAQCFRPAGIVRDSQGRYYVSSDSGEGELFLLGRT